MQRRGFEEAVELVTQMDSRYDRDAYLFLRDTLDYTLQEVRKRNNGDDRHVMGQELLAGFRDFAIDQFGPMAMTVFNEWGLKECRDVGNMVFNLVEVGAFGKTDEDSPEDFDDGYDFHQTFVEPYLPAKRSDQACRKNQQSKPRSRVGK